LVVLGQAQVKKAQEKIVIWKRGVRVKSRGVH
jgi:hypothetical protein